jgi:hypothetical protein
MGTLLHWSMETIIQELEIRNVDMTMLNDEMVLGLTSFEEWARKVKQELMQGNTHPGYD